MFALFLLLMPLIGLLIVFSSAYPVANASSAANSGAGIFNLRVKTIALNSSTCALLVSLIMFALFDYSSNQFQFVQEVHEIGSYNLFLGVDGLSVYFVLLTTIIMPVSLLSNWTSISHSLKSFLITILLLQTLLLLVFLVLDILQFYIFFESILPPLFILIGLFGSSDRVRASFYLFLYTLLGSLFLLLSILTMHSIMGMTDLDALYKNNFNYFTQLVLFVGIFIAFAVKTPVIFLNNWLLRAHVESPLSGSIILAGIVLKLSLYGILRLILPLLPKADIICTWFVYVVGVLTIIYASASTLRTIDVKELIAYSSVSHAAVYLMGVFSNVIQGIEGGITLGLAHGFVSSGLFICAGGVLYDRSSTRLIIFYRGLAQLMPIFCVLFFILCLGNCGAPLTLNFVGEFMSLYGAFENLTLLGALASSSIIFSAAYTIYMFNRIAFAGSYSKFFDVNLPDLNKREFYILLTLVIFTVVLGIYPSSVLDGLHYSVTTLIYYSPQMCVIPFMLTKAGCGTSGTTRHNSINNFHLITRHVRHKSTSPGVNAYVSHFENKIIQKDVVSLENLENTNLNSCDQDIILSETSWIRSDYGIDTSIRINEDPNPKTHDTNSTSYIASTSPENEDTVLNDTGWIPSDHGIDTNLRADNNRRLDTCDIKEVGGISEHRYLPSVTEGTNNSTQSSYTCLDKSDSYSTPDCLNIEKPADINVDGVNVVSRVLENIDNMSITYLLNMIERHAELLWYFFGIELIIMLLALLISLGRFYLESGRNHARYKSPRHELTFLNLLVMTGSIYYLINFILIVILKAMLVFILDHFRMIFFGYQPTMMTGRLYDIEVPKYNYPPDCLRPKYYYAPGYTWPRILRLFMILLQMTLYIVVITSGFEIDELDHWILRMLLIIGVLQTMSV